MLTPRLTCLNLCINGEAAPPHWFRALAAQTAHAVSLSRITPNQYGMCYRKALPQEKERTQQRLGILSETIPVIIPNNDDTFAIQDRGLPEAFLTRDDRLMILRSKGLAVVDTTRFQDLQEHNKQYARLLMFTPWSDEKVFLGQARQSAEACKALYTMHEAAINSVEEQCNRLIRLSVQREWDNHVWWSTSSVTHVSHIQHNSPEKTGEHSLVASMNLYGTQTPNHTTTPLYYNPYYNPQNTPPITMGTSPSGLLYRIYNSSPPVFLIPIRSRN